MTRTTAQPRAGVIDDIEREDDSKGYEPEDAARVDVALALLPNLTLAQAGWEVAA
ncbi:hypothetical protein ACFYWS_38795 [Streptomyces sp. NPDC002795]|uniref:hypothetical protein n=1 Tax=unclassified Streptomyces TaxID=2593676 RepID=UPI002254224C|nr:hypothetical protein [Streptomyces sp. NBC_01306]MCX4729421.1 hypothetical protein [Streptomyces sp. NBC_01306]WST82751.1 hypothetical protein OG762_52000 [Streptomyces sp. NBC_01136]